MRPPGCVWHPGGAAPEGGLRGHRLRTAGDWRRYPLGNAPGDRLRGCDLQCSLAGGVWVLRVFGHVRGAGDIGHEAQQVVSAVARQDGRWFGQRGEHGDNSAVPGHPLRPAAGGRTPMASPAAANAMVVDSRRRQGQRRVSADHPGGRCPDRQRGLPLSQRVRPQGGTGNTSSGDGVDLRRRFHRGQFH